MLLLRVIESGKTEIGDFQNPIVVEKKIWSFDVTMQYPSCMTMLKAWEQLMQVAFHLFKKKPNTNFDILKLGCIKKCTMRKEVFFNSNEINLWFSERNFRVRGEASKVMLHILEDKVKATWHSWCYKTFQFDNIGMIETSQNYYLPCHKTHTVSLQIIKSDLLESNDLPCVQISSLVYIAICPLPNLVEKPIAFQYVWIVKPHHYTVLLVNLHHLQIARDYLIIIMYFVLVLVLHDSILAVHASEMSQKPFNVTKLN